MGDNQDTWPAGMTATMNVTYTQANAAGGAVVCEITPGAGNEFIYYGHQAKNSGTNGVIAQVATATGGVGIQFLGSVASGAGTVQFLSIGTVTGGIPVSGAAAGVGYPIVVSGTQTLQIKQSAAGAQNDTFQVVINIRVKTGQMPTVTHANSTNAANVSVTSGAESFTTV